MARSTQDLTGAFTEVERLLRDLQNRVGQLTGQGLQATSAVPDMVSDLVTQVADRVRTGARTVGDEATRIGTDALRKVETEVEHRPLTTLAIAAGIGFLVGLLGRR